MMRPQKIPKFPPAFHPSALSWEKRFVMLPCLKLSWKRGGQPCGSSHGSEHIGHPCSSSTRISSEMHLGK